jgi:peptide chain release factor 1
LGETENVVNEEQDILSFFVPKIFRDCQTSQGNTSTGSWRLVHLTEDQGDLGLSIKLNNLSLLHFVVQIVTLTSTLSDTSEDRVTTVSLGNVVDQLLNEHSLSDTSSSEKSNLSSTSIWGKEIDDLDTSDQDFGSGGLISERGCVGVNRELLGVLDGTTLINWVTSNVHNTTERSWTDWHHDGVSSIGCTMATDETLSTIHSNCADNVLSQMMRNLEDELVATIVGFESVQNRRKLVSIEFDIHDGTNDLMDLAMQGTITRKPRRGTS